MAVVSVLLYHVGLGPKGGFIGVDIFFVLSGFLITGLLLREHQRTGRISLTSFWARRARRLLPAGVLVLVATGVLARFLLPASRWPGIGTDTVAAAGYLLNWRLAGESVNYLDQGAAPSPLQHYWSLSVEEQFYLFWPVLMIGLLRTRSRTFVVGGVAAVVAGSLGLALATHTTQSYFTTQTRVWELAAGALCALLVQARPVPIGARAGAAAGVVAGWTGLALLGLALVTVTPATTWPGPATVIVVLATALVITTGGVRAVLSQRWMTWIGDISYPLYLWHWPLVVLAQREGDLSRADGVFIVVVSTILAYLTTVVVERPLQHARVLSSARAGLTFGAALMIVAVTAGVALGHSRSLSFAADAVGAGAPVVVQQRATALAPLPEDAKQDLPDLYARGCQTGMTAPDVHPCVYDYSTSSSGPVVVAVGDSRMAQWMPAFQELARAQHWKLISMTKASCPFTQAQRAVPAEQGDSCRAWNQSVLQQLPGLAPDLVVTSDLDYYQTEQNGKPLTGKANRDEMIRGASARLSQLKQAGLPVIALAETPTLKQDPADCVSLHLSDLASCARSRKAALRNAGVLAAAARQSGVPSVNLNDHICTPTLCPAVTGDMMIYRDVVHLTASYARTLAPWLDKALRKKADPSLFQG